MRGPEASEGMTTGQMEPPSPGVQEAAHTEECDSLYVSVVACEADRTRFDSPPNAGGREPSQRRDVYR
eukprot:CAMPEP_0174710364 /NCGR_PEP_ID=MMETSP1094-20130205/12024_1 /TAXON_ID=156173 /ORGANISM="Chrysochromulina brevifilum, Strain UTEX LB 985" /LENGTH=67 /DNA_ID=CAMNT_0015909161 /DNA_START=37 /DNA_END=237 /DNA_ORIENTATION=-